MMSRNVRRNKILHIRRVGEKHPEVTLGVGGTRLGEKEYQERNRNHPWGRTKGQASPEVGEKPSRNLSALLGEKIKICETSLSSHYSVGGS